PDKETIYQAYVIDAERRLLGTVSLRELVTARAHERVADLMTTDVVTRRAGDGQEEVASLISKYDLLSLPILDDADRLVGIVTYDDAMDVAEEEATEDFHRVGTVAALDSSVREAGIPLLYRKRVGWLVVLIFANAFSGAGIALFEEIIAAHVVLVFFLPLLIASSGNAGAQSATLTVRALATGDIRPKDWGRMLGRELLVAVLLGATMGLIVSALGIVRGGAEVAFVVASTMVLVVVIGSLLGMSLPFVLERLRLDPATASVPLVTSLADIAGVLIYFSLASWALQIPAVPG
ncbi:MAG: magnesium transporter, partial [Halofilum sp. (in: g-proteobacteria)]